MATKQPQSSNQYGVSERFAFRIEPDGLNDIKLYCGPGLPYSSPSEFARVAMYEKLLSMANANADVERGRAAKARLILIESESRKAYRATKSAILNNFLDEIREAESIREWQQITQKAAEIKTLLADDDSAVEAIENAMKRKGI